MSYIENRKVMINVLLSFALVVIIMCVVQFQYVFAEDGEIVYVEDLKENILVKPGDILYVYQDYHRNASGTYYEDGIVIDYEKNKTNTNSSQSREHKRFILEPNTYHKIKTYDEVFSSEFDYSSWIVNIMDFFWEAPSISLVPTYMEKNTKINVPSKENSYTLDNSSNNENNYYLIQTLNSNVIKNEGWGKSPRGEYYFQNYGTMKMGEKVTLEFEFEADKGQFLYFDYRSFLGSSGHPVYNKYIAKLNDQEISITGCKHFEQGKNYRGEDYIYCSDLEDFTYKPNLVKIKESGKQKLVIEYEVLSESNVTNRLSYTYNYGYIRNVSLLTHVNSGKKLDTKDLTEGDKLVYIEFDDDGGITPISDTFVYESGNVVIEPEKDYGCYTCGDEPIWTNDPKDNCKLNDDIKSQGMCVNNPKTGITKTILIILIVASFAILGVVLYNRRNRFSKI